MIQAHRARDFLPLEFPLIWGKTTLPSGSVTAKTRILRASTPSTGLSAGYRSCRTPLYGVAYTSFWWYEGHRLVPPPLVHSILSQSQTFEVGIALEAKFSTASAQTVADPSWRHYAGTVPAAIGTARISRQSNEQTAWIPARRRLACIELLDGRDLHTTGSISSAAMASSFEIAIDGTTMPTGDDGGVVGSDDGFVDSGGCSRHSRCIVNKRSSLHSMSSICRWQKSKYIRLRQTFRCHGEACSRTKVYIPEMYMVISYKNLFGIITVK